MRKPKATRDPHKGALTNTKTALKHIDAALQSNNLPSFLLAIRDVAAAHGLSNVARQTKLRRQSLYHMLAKKGNPEIKSVWNILQTLDLRFCVTAK